MIYTHIYIYIIESVHCTLDCMATEELGSSKGCGNGVEEGHTQDEKVHGLVGMHEWSGLL